MTTEEAARFLGVHEGTMHKLHLEPDGPNATYTIGKGGVVLNWDKQELLDWQRRRWEAKRIAWKTKPAHKGMAEDKVDARAFIHREIWARIVDDAVQAKTTPTRLVSQLIEREYGKA